MPTHPSHVRANARAISLRFAIPLVAALMIVAATIPAWSQLVTYNTAGNAGTETTEPTVTVAANLSATALTLGAGVTPAANANRLGGSNFFDTGDTNPTTLAESIAGNDYFQFTITPTAGNQVNVTEFRFIFDRSASGPSNVALRSSADNFGANLGSAAVAAGNTTTFTSLTFTLTSTAAVTFRLYGFGATATGGTGGFDTGNTTSTPNVLLNGTVTPAGVINNIYFDVNGATTGSGVTNGGIYAFSGAFFNSVADGTGATAAFTSGQTATFSAGTDATGLSYTVNIDTPVTSNGLSIEEGNVTLASGGGTLTLTGPSVNVATGATATISQAISGTVGLTKDGAGALTLSSTTSNFSGAVTINSGILSISADTNLGNTGNGIALGGGTLQIAGSVALGATRTLTGTGSLDVSGGNTLTIGGTVNAGTLTFVNTGGVALTGSSNAATGLSFSAPGTLSGNALSLPGGITSTQTTGTALVANNVDFGAGTRTIAVTDGPADVDLRLSGNLSGASVLAKTGAGTLQLSGDNSALSGVAGTTPASLRLGVAGTTPTTGGTVSFTTATALGAAQVQFNGGTLRNDAAGPLSVVNGLSIGAQDAAATTPGGAVFSGQNTTFQGAVALFRATGTSLQQAITVNNTTTFSGVFATLTSAQGGGSGASTGFTVGGTGRLVLNGAAPNTFTEPVVIAGIATLEAGKDGALAANGSVTVNAGGTLLLSNAAAADRIGNAVPLALAGGTFSTGGLSEGGPGTTGIGALTLSATSNIDFGLNNTGSLLQFAGVGAHAANSILQILNYAGNPVTGGGTDQLLFAGMSSEFTSVYNPGDVSFNGVSGYVPVQSTGFYEIVPVPEPATVLGGFLMLAALGWSQRRRMGGWIAAFQARTTGMPV